MYYTGSTYIKCTPNAFFPRNICAGCNVIHYRKVCSVRKFLFRHEFAAPMRNRAGFRPSNPGAHILIRRLESHSIILSHIYRTRSTAL